MHPLVQRQQGGGGGRGLLHGLLATSLEGDAHGVRAEQAGRRGGREEAAVVVCQPLQAQPLTQCGRQLGRAAHVLPPGGSNHHTTITVRITTALGRSVGFSLPPYLWLSAMAS